MIEKEADVAEVRTLTKDAVFEEASFVHYFDLPTNNVVNKFGHLSCALHYWQFYLLHPSGQWRLIGIEFFVFFCLSDDVVELGINEDFSFETEIAVLKGKFKHFILMLKDAIEYLILQPRLELLKYFRMLHQHSIKSKFLTVIFSDAPKHQLRQNFLLLHLVQLHYPMVNLLLLFSQLVPNLKVLK